MAREIKPTPVITGEDAKRFQEAMDNIKPLSKKELEEMEKAYELLKKRATNFTVV
jgi:hypothetical protein